MVLVAGRVAARDSAAEQRSVATREQASDLGEVEHASSHGDLGGFTFRVRTRGQRLTLFG